jgi:hypothetical protein
MIGFYLINEAVWGYGFFIVGLLVAVADIILKRKKDNHPHTPHH